MIDKIEEIHIKRIVQQQMHKSRVLIEDVMQITEELANLKRCYYSEKRKLIIYNDNRSNYEIVNILSKIQEVESVISTKCRRLSVSLTIAASYVTLLTINEKDSESSLVLLDNSVHMLDKMIDYCMEFPVDLSSIAPCIAQADIELSEVNNPSTKRIVNMYRDILHKL